MIKDLSLNDFIREFQNSNRDNFSYEGYEELYNYYNEFENFELDVVGVDSDVCEYDKEDIIKDYSYLIDKYEDFKKENYEDEDDEEIIKEEYYNFIIDELERHTTLIKLSNDCILIWNF